MFSLLCFQALYILGLLASLGHAIRPCELTCNDLSQALPHIFYSGSEALVPLWSNFQARVQPACRIEPRNPQEVREILRAVRRYECHFAVLGGGTSPFKGASNADRGVTIDMRRMREIAFVEGTDLQVSVGAGNLWADVYRALQPWNMSAVGTRNSLTGVVGSILGGGISFFSERYGWACDAVVEFELVQADSTVVKASQSVNSDIFWALKGGGNNFGIVTSVVLEVFRNPPRWYTFQLFSMEDLAPVLGRLVTHTATMPPNVWQIATTLGWHVPTERFVISERMVASELVELPEFIPHQSQDGTWEKSPVLQTNIYERSILEMAQKMDGMNEAGFFNLFGSLTVRSNVQVLLAIAKIFQEEVALIRDAKDLQGYIVYNPLTVSAMRHMRKHGGNALGLSEEDDPLIVVNMNLHWSDEQDEPGMRRFMRRLIDQFSKCALKLDGLHPYIFQNHAFEEQDVFPGYGADNLAGLKSVRQSIDPDAVFQRLQLGFFKLEPELLKAQGIKSEL